MNKIKMNEIILSNDKSTFLEINEEKFYTINVDKNINCVLNILGIKDYKLIINVDDNSNLLINSLNKDNSVNVEINLNKNAKIIYNHSVISSLNSHNYFNVMHKENNSISILNNNGINLSNNDLFFNIDGIVPKKLININCNQSSKIINFSNGNSKIIPNLIIDSNDIVANHSAYIGEIGEEEKFYFLSRGISEEKIKELIYKATMLGKMDLSEEEERFNKIINEWW